MDRRETTMKKLFLATVRSAIQQYHGGDRDEVRAIPVYAEQREDVDTLVREAVEGDDVYGDRTTILSIDVEETIGAPD